MNNSAKKHNVCTVKSCGSCSGAQCALGVSPETPLDRVVCPWQKAILELEREEVPND